jgi:hypothetical protein
MVTKTETERNSNKAVRVLLGFGMFSLIGFTGCQTVQDYSLTAKLWSTPEMRHFAEPAEDPKLEVFVLSSGEMLVRYDELRERDGTIRRRAYLASENVDRISRRKKPRFSNPTDVTNGQPVPLIDIPSNSSSQPAVVSASYSRERKEFVLTGMPGLNGAYELPVYLENNGTALRIVLTPLALGGDIAVVGAVAGVIAAYAYAHAAFSPTL